MAEAKIEKLVEFALSVKDDPDFHRLVFPPAVLAKLAELGAPVKPKEYSASAAVDRCYGMGSSETYTTSSIEVRDLTTLSSDKFPPLPIEPEHKSSEPPTIKINLSDKTTGEEEEE